MTARGIGRKKKSGQEKRGGRRVVSRSSLASRPRASQTRAGRYSGADPGKPLKRLRRAQTPAARKTDPDPKPRRPSKAMLDLMRGWKTNERAAAQKAVDFFETKLRLVKGHAAGQPYHLPQWFEGLIRRVFGPKNKDGTRRCRTFYLEVASKNSKSTGVGGIALYMLAEDGERGAECYTVAKNRKQARLVFNSARAMALESPYLRAKLNIFRHTVESATDELSKLEPISSDSGTQDGVDPNFVAIDELHRITSRDIVDTLEAKQASRKQPLEVMITTAGELDVNSIAWEKHEYARGIIEGRIKDPTWVAAIYSVPDTDDWKDEKVWHKANPNLGVSISMDFLRSQFRKVSKSSSAALAFRRFHLNQWVGAEHAWLPMDAWDRCAGPVDVQALRGQVCCSGLDLGSTRDLTAHVLVFPGPDGLFYVLPRFFMPRERLAEHLESDKVPYDVWAREGHLTLTPGNTIDFLGVRQSIEDDFAAFKLKDLAFDRAGAAQMTQELNLSIGEGNVERAEDDQLKVWPFPQTFLGMSEPSKDLYDLILAGKIRHGGNPILRWMAECVTVIQDNHANIKPVKPDRRKHGRRIDGVVALIMGLARARHQKTSIDFGEGKSVYENEEMLVL